MPFLSKQRIQKILQDYCDKGMVEIRRATNKLGPDPFEYAVPHQLFKDFLGKDITKTKK